MTSISLLDRMLLCAPAMGIRQFLERAQALSGAPPAALDRMAAASSLRTLKRGELLWHAGDPARSIAIVKCGLVKLVRHANRGRNSICAIFGPPEVIGALAVLNGDPLPMDAVGASDAATVIQIPAGLVLDASHYSPDLALSIARAMHNGLAQLEDKVEVLSAGSVESRIATLLLQLYNRFGDDFDDGTSKIPVTLSRRELADLVATSFETAIRVMTRWERRRIVETTHEGFTIQNLPALQLAAGAELGATAAE